MDEDSAPPANDSSETENSLNVVPRWLRGMRPIVWKSYGSGCYTKQKHLKKSRGRNCCLFSPLQMCTSNHVVNGFCMFHLRAIFNLVYHIDTAYTIVDGRAILVSNERSFVADPQPINNEITAVFPVFEMFSEMPRVEQFKLHHFARYLQNSGSVGWEKTYSMHVNFLHNLITLRHQMPSSASEHELNSTLSIHWNTWNEHQSWLLANTPASLYIYYATENGTVQSAPIGGFTAITQQICRLFSLPYSSVDETSFFPTLPCYGFHVRGHLSYLNNACSSGTTVSESGMRAIGNIATLQCIRTDKHRNVLLHWNGESRNCDEHCVSTRINLNTTTLNNLSAVTNSAPKREGDDSESQQNKRSRGM